MKITNNSKALQGINARGGAVFLQPGETRDVDVPQEEMEGLKGLSFLGLEGVDRGSSYPPKENGSTPNTGTAPASAYAVVDKGRGWFVVTKDGADVTKSLREDAVKGFDAKSEDEKSAFVEANKPED